MEFYKIRIKVKIYNNNYVLHLMYFGMCVYDVHLLLMYEFSFCS